MIVLATMRMFAWLVLLSQAVVPEERDVVGTDAFEGDDDALMLAHTGYDLDDFRGLLLAGRAPRCSPAFRIVIPRGNKLHVIISKC